MGDKIDLVEHAEADRERGSRFRDLFQVVMLGVWYKSVNFGADRVPPTIRRPFPSEDATGFKDFYLKAKANIWP